ncbi:hypothetical protein ABID70_002424 [Clavibacter michiganensis]|nr:hypothetical protein [Clavibacter michiganensis]MDQ0409470.1 hypothetical protein [Clavibacter michiganensis]
MAAAVSTEARIHAHPGQTTLFFMNGPL